MSTWAIGDVQGCMSSLERLLAEIEHDPARDRLWIVGDLVNRGPRSLDVLRWAKALDEQREGALACVLGNHDLHLLQRVAKVAGPKKRDTLDEILDAPDRDALIDWLRHRPFVRVDGEHVCVHAGLHPRWSVKKARKLAGELEDGLRADSWKEWIAQLAEKDKPAAWDDDLLGSTRVRTILSYLVRVRCIDDRGVPDPDFDDHPRKAKKGTRPWFEAPDAAWADHTVLFGHWAALGLSIGTHHIGLDSGCVWGRQLTAMRLEDRYVVQVESVEHRH
jgi:bis(5'-nucleosyl)-tetraphosphatase (symmetrical)